LETNIKSYRSYNNSKAKMFGFKREHPISSGEIKAKKKKKKWFNYNLRKKKKKKKY